MDFLNICRALTITLLISAAAAMSSDAQIRTTLNDSGYYYVVVNGDTLSQHLRLDKALQSASEYALNGDFEIVRDFRLSGSSYFYDETIILEEVTDTVYVPADTVYIEADVPQTPIDSTYKGPILFTDEIRFTHNTDRETGNERLDFVIRTAMVDTLYTEIRCGSQWVENNIFPRPGATLQYGIIWECNDDLIYDFEAVKNLWRQSYTHRVPAALLGVESTGMFTNEFSEYSGFTYSKIWGALSYAVADGRLTVQLAERNIARLMWEQIPEHSDIRYTVTEVVDSSHSTGAHIGGRHSMEFGNSVETYLNSNGLGVSIFDGGAWSNPVNFDIPWTYGEPITYTVEIVADTIRAMHGGETFEYVAPEVGAVGPGRFAIGSTGAGTYYIERLEVDILD